MRKNMKVLKKAAAMTIAAAVISSLSIPQAFGYGETTGSSTLISDTQGTSAYQTWKADVWENAKSNSGNIILTPGKTEKALNFAWYSESSTGVAVKLSKNADMSNSKAYAGTSEAINKTNVAGNNYTSANKVSIEKDIEPDTTYYYQYTSDNGNTWSSIYKYQSKSASAYQAILVGDPQIGASGSSGQGTTDDVNIAVDTYNWNKTLNQARITAPNASFILSAGDQIDYSSPSGNGYAIRESEYAGYLYPSALRGIPVATTIGNHESKGDDYKYHYNNPNSEDNLGTTASGGDYYFSYGDTLVVSLNSNNRNVEEHRQLLQKAVNSNKNAKWKIVMFHHDIYGSGAPHSDVDGANLRVLFAPLMDEFKIDICLTGHDHSYARSYQIIDGTAIDYDGNNNVATNPEGTLYIAAGSASGSKFYNLNQTKQYYIAERSNIQIPTFSVLDIDENSFTIRTYDYNGSKYADDFTILKTNDGTVNTDSVSASELIEKAANIDKTKYTKNSVEAVEKAAEGLKNVLNETGEDIAITQLSGAYDNSLNADNVNDPLNYYGYAQTNYKNETSTALKQGVSTLLDKTLYGNDNAENKLAAQKFEEAYDSLNEAINNLKLNSNGTIQKDNTTNNDKKNDTDNSTSDGSNMNNSNNGADSNSNNNTNKAPQTGDTTHTAALIFLVIASGIAIIGLSVKKKED